MVFGSKNQGNFSGSSRRDDIPSGITRRSAVFAIETGSAGCADNKGTVGNCFPYGVIAFCAFEYIPAVNGHGSCPETPGSCLADYGQLGFSHILHRPRDGADVSRAAGSYEDDADVGQHDDASSEFSGTMRAGSIPCKRTKLVFRNNASVLGVEFSSVAQVFVHNRCAVVDVLGTEDVR